MDLQTLIIAMSIPSGVTAFCFWMIEQKIKKQQTEAEEKEKIREKNEVLIIKASWRLLPWEKRRPRP